MRKIMYVLAASMLVLAVAASPALAGMGALQPPNEQAEENKAQAEENKAEAKEKKAAAQESQPESAENGDEGKARAEEKKRQADENKAEASQKGDEGKAKAEQNKAEAAEKKAEAGDKAKGPKAGKAPKAEKGKDKDVVPGNNGTIKIDGVPLDGSNGNEPHVGCEFALNFFGFDEAVKTSTVTFTGQAPSGGGTFLVDEVTFSGGEATATYSLSDFDAAALASATPHPMQGYHVKVTTSTPYSNGADVKHKVFWIDCSSPAETLPADQETHSEDSPARQDEIEDEVLGSRISRDGGDRAPVQAQADESNPEIFGLALPFTGTARTILLVLVAVGMVAAGVTLLARRRA